MVHDSHIVRAIGTSSWATVDQANYKLQAQTNGLTIYVRAILKSEAWPTVVQLKRKP